MITRTQISLGTVFVSAIDGVELWQAGHLRRIRIVSGLVGSEPMPVEIGVRIEWEGLYAAKDAYEWALISAGIEPPITRPPDDWIRRPSEFQANGDAIPLESVEAILLVGYPDDAVRQVREMLSAYAVQSAHGQLGVGGPAKPARKDRGASARGGRARGA